MVVVLRFIRKFLLTRRYFLIQGHTVDKSMIQLEYKVFEELLHYYAWLFDVSKFLLMLKNYCMKYSKIRKLICKFWFDF